MSDKKTPPAAKAPATAAAAKAPATAAAATPAKKTKTAAPLLPQTDKQKAAAAALEAANQEALAELRKDSEPKLAAAIEKVTAAAAKLKTAKDELKALQDACGIVPVKSVGVAVAKHFTYIKSPETGPQQMLQIIEIIKAHGAKGISREDLIAKMETDVTANMDRKRLLAFYKKRLVTEGLVAVS